MSEPFREHSDHLFCGHTPAESGWTRPPAPEPPAAADEAWEALLDEAFGKRTNPDPIRDSMDEVWQRHRPRIEAALATPPPLDAAIRAVTALLLDSPSHSPAANAYGKVLAILAGDHKTGRPDDGS